MDTVETEAGAMFHLDGNAAAGALAEIFGMEMTANQVECAGCGREGEIGTLQVFLDAPGIVLRCPACQNILMRIVQAPQAIFLELRGAAYLRLPRLAAQG